MGRSNVEKEIKKLLRITYCVKPDKKFILELVEKLKTMEDSIIMANNHLVWWLFFIEIFNESSLHTYNLLVELMYS